MSRPPQSLLGLAREPPYAVLITLKRPAVVQATTAEGRKRIMRRWGLSPAKATRPAGRRSLRLAGPGHSGPPPRHSSEGWNPERGREWPILIPSCADANHNRHSNYSRESKERNLALGLVPSEVRSTIRPAPGSYRPSRALSIGTNLYLRL